VSGCSRRRHASAEACCGVAAAWTSRHASACGGLLAVIDFLGQLGGVGVYKRTRRPLSMRRCIAVALPIYRIGVETLSVFKLKSNEPN